MQRTKDKERCFKRARSSVFLALRLRLKKYNDTVSKILGGLLGSFNVAA